MQNPKILMIINEFPPTGESGVQRPLKFLKYLSRMDWDTYVVTPKKPTKTVLDFTLLSEVPSQSKIYYTQSLGIKGNSVDQIASVRFNLTKKANPAMKALWSILKVLNDLAFPLDKQIGWVPFALFRAISVIKTNNIRNVYITGYPFSAFLIGIFLKLLFKKRIFWVADYRDAWQFEPVQGEGVHSFRKRIIIWADDLTLRICDRAVFVTDYIHKKYVDKFDWIRNKSQIITNGFDEDDFSNIAPRNFDKFTFMYMGKIYSHSRNPIPVLDAIRQCGLDNFQYVHVGTISSEALSEIDKRNYRFFKYEGYKSHAEALNYSAGANINILIINDDEESVGVFTGKVFELIRLGKPILAVGPHKGIIKDLFEQTGVGLYACMRNQEEILDKIKQLITTSTLQNSKKSEISRFSRMELTCQLAALYLQQAE